jgi:hypothetical protein
MTGGLNAMTNYIEIDGQWASVVRDVWAEQSQAAPAMAEDNGWIAPG